jgi:cytochrome oxidase Cu insertion factor (SCO1/SenC/PrrC family)
MLIDPIPDSAPTGPAARAGRPGFSAILSGIILAAIFGLLAAGLIALAILARNESGGGFNAAATASPDPASFAYAEIRPAPLLRLTDQDGQPFDLASLRGRPVLVFFGYTHCPDVCPATVGIVNEVLAEVGDGPRAVFTSIDPERDDVAAMKSYLTYLPSAYSGLSGTPQEVAENAAAWGVQYARIDQDSAAGYAMAHTADIFLVDGQGDLRAHFPFGIKAAPIIDAVRGVLAETAAASSVPASPASTGDAPPSASASTPVQTSTPPAGTDPSVSPAVTLYPEVVSTSTWAGETNPVILRVADSGGLALDGSAPLTVQLATFEGVPQGAPVTAIPLLPEGETRPYFIAPISFPAPGAWRLLLASGAAAGSIAINAQDPGRTLPIGGPAPDIDTPTLADVGGVVRAVTTQPQPDLRLSLTSTADALAMGKPYVIVIDSARFKVSPECGRALSMIRYLLDRWGDRAVFIHLEPFEYQIITEEPVLSGSLTDPPLNEYARAFGLGQDPWPAVNMPWVFVVDAQRTVRAKYIGVVGTGDIDLILTQILGKGQIGG